MSINPRTKRTSLLAVYSSIPLNTFALAFQELERAMGRSFPWGEDELGAISGIVATWVLRGKRSVYYNSERSMITGGNIDRGWDPKTMSSYHNWLKTAGKN